MIFLTLFQASNFSWYSIPASDCCNSIKNIFCEICSPTRASTFSARNTAKGFNNAVTDLGCISPLDAYK